MSHQTVLNPIFGQAAPEVNPVRLSAKVSKPRLSSTTDHAQPYGHSATRITVPARIDSVGREGRPERVPPNKRVGFRSSVAKLKVDTSIADQYLSLEVLSCCRSRQSSDIGRIPRQIFRLLGSA